MHPCLVDLPVWHSICGGLQTLECSQRAATSEVVQREVLQQLGYYGDEMNEASVPPFAEGSFRGFIELQVMHSQDLSEAIDVFVDMPPACLKSFWFLC